MSKLVSMRSAPLARARILVTTVAFITTLSSIPWEAVHARTLRGIYLVPWKGDMNTKQMRALVENSAVDGFYIALSWKDLEPEQHKFDWSLLDKQLAAVAASRKRAEIGVIAGASSPEWVYRAGAQRFDTIVAGKFSWAFGRSISIPVPWDQVYLAAWTEFVTALGEHYASNPFLDAVKLTGINVMSDEIELPTFNSRKIVSDGKKRVAVPDLVQEWRGLGYSASKIERAFTTIMQTFAIAFPHQQIVVMTDHDGFPPLGDDGEDAIEASHLGTVRLLADGRDLLGQRLVGQYNGLKAGAGSLSTISELAKFGRTNPIGFQTSWPISHNTTDSDGRLTPLCIMNSGNSPCYRREVMQGVVDIALENRASFVELFPADAEDPQLADIIQAAHTRLAAGGDR